MPLPFLFMRPQRPPFVPNGNSKFPLLNQSPSGAGIGHALMKLWDQPQATQPGNNAPPNPSPPPTSADLPAGAGRLIDLWNKATNFGPGSQPPDIQLAQALEFFARPPLNFENLTPLEKIGKGSAEPENAGKDFRRSMNDKEEGTPCLYCRTPTTRKPGPRQYNGDHKIPKSRGGDNSSTNHANSCRTCNLSKGRRTVEEWYNWIKEWWERHRSGGGNG